jgi:hypothetical protein
MTLFLRQRMVPASLVAMCGSFALLIWLGGWVDVPDQPLRMIVVLVAGPATIASVLGIAMWSPSLDLERSSSYPLRWPRLLHLGALLAIGLVTSSAIVADWPNQVITLDQAWFWIRNVMAMVGAVLIVAGILNARLSWIAPTFLAMIAVLVVVRRTDDPYTPVNELFSVQPWLVIARHDSSMTSWIIATALLVSGYALIAIRGPKVQDAAEA